MASGRYRVDSMASVAGIRVGRHCGQWAVVAVAAVRVRPYTSLENALSFKFTPIASQFRLMHQHFPLPRLPLPRLPIPERPPHRSHPMVPEAGQVLSVDGPIPKLLVKSQRGTTVMIESM